jgi:hypothetical protein
MTEIFGKKNLEKVNGCLQQPCCQCSQNTDKEADEQQKMAESRQRKN